MVLHTTYNSYIYFLYSTTGLVGDALHERGSIIDELYDRTDIHEKKRKKALTKQKLYVMK